MDVCFNMNRFTPHFLRTNAMTGLVQEWVRFALGSLFVKTNSIAEPVVKRTWYIPGIAPVKRQAYI